MRKHKGYPEGSKVPEAKFSGKSRNQASESRTEQGVESLQRVGFVRTTLLGHASLLYLTSYELIIVSL